MYGLMGKFTATDSQRQALTDILLQAASDLSDHTPCLLYVVSHDPADDHGIWVTEVWESKDAHQASLELEATQTLIATARPLIAGMSNRTEFDPLGGKGL